MLKVEFVYEGSFLELDDAVGKAVVTKLTELTRQLYDKVEENLSGKILNKVTGQLSASIEQSVETGAEVAIGTVRPVPASAKAWALEKGGRGAYDIYPVKARLLQWVTKEGNRAFAKHVIHPPSEEFAYLRLGLEEMREIVPAEFIDAINSAITKSGSLGGGNI